MISGKTIREILSGNSSVNIDDIEEIMLEYPYFQAARLLHLQILENPESIRYTGALKKAAVYVGDREGLFLKTEGRHVSWSQLFDKKNSLEKSFEETDAFTLIDQFLSAYTQEGKTMEDERSILEQTISNPGTVSTDYLSMLNTEKEETPENIHSELEHIDLIDSFIEKTENQDTPYFIFENEVLEQKENRETVIADEIVTEEAFLTESLAKIYIKQRRYSKALEIIKKLSLKYPEKNIYFADQIRFLEKLITNIKTE
ncbi:tetratricopeptide repeat protein [Coprobacter tertius]|uniref:Tetratricopeptide repeat protein n=1 Tax=Coprobacter tertius TaxID=2944915 RepID=A0ABT1MH76_9BACT|nr:tetratricopeptide repeat protein [Coprobacter tertius]MCP9611985.1 tetratricopeptide repeat protein [Coprobacter tertius]